MKRGLFIVLLAIVLGGCEPGATPTPVAPTRTVSPPSPTLTAIPTATARPTPAPPPTNTSRALQSAEVGDQYKIHVSLPGGYDPDASPGYHVVYLLDGDWYFDGADRWMTKGGVAKIAADLRNLGAMPPVIVVGVGYAGDNKRERDLYEDPDRFYAFIRSELVPLIDDEYNTVSSPEGRILVGHSLGGYFVMYALLAHEVPDPLFRDYIAVSGDYTSYERKLFAAEQDLYDRLGSGALSGVNLYLAAGSNEYGWVINSNREMAQRLGSRNYTGFRLEFTAYGTHDHYTIVGPAIRSGLRWLFEE
ncbi:MAG: hypothetical protein KKA73_17480 [Chloroflexi bacterium]|nr:hypothetical protein [Chloroflexota bacterium]MBU1749479.1 hypothetical protein [Chloroflexota bacterium]MBU1878925.1 hypothetical protein [Chloroflexota bacterium]